MSLDLWQVLTHVFLHPFVLDQFVDFNAKISSEVFAIYEAYIDIVFGDLESIA